MEENRPLTREEIEDILDKIHIQEYEWFIDDKEDEFCFCRSSEEDAELVEKTIKGLINQYNNDYISKDKIRDTLLKFQNEYGEDLETTDRLFIGKEVVQYGEDMLDEIAKELDIKLLKE